MEIVYRDADIVVCLKPAGVLSTDEPGGMPELVREALGEPDADVRTVHRLDRVVGGLMVLARGADAAAELSRQIREGEFEKEYLALVHGRTKEQETLRDLMLRDKARKMSFVTEKPGKGVQEAVLEYRTLAYLEDRSLIRIRLHTGRTHQIRCQFAAHGWPLVGERKYSTLDETCGLALWSCLLRFHHPRCGETMIFSKVPPPEGPWQCCYGLNMFE